MADKHADHEEHEHMDIPKYVGIFGALFILTIITYFVALSDLDSMFFAGANTLVALFIALVKMTLVVLFFMHVYWNGKLIWLTAAGSFVFLAIMFAFTLQDYATRGAGIFTK